MKIPKKMKCEICNSPCSNKICKPCQFKNQLDKL